MRVIVLGAGLVGAPMAIDLSKEPRFEVTVADYSAEALNSIRNKCAEVLTVQQDLTLPEDVTALVQEYDLVVNAVPGFMGFETAKAILKAKKSSVDISFYEEDPFQLDELAKQNDVTMIMDCGVCPGMNNILIMHTARKLDEVHRAVTYVGGLPETREWPSEYKAVFSPIDVIEEYTRPARFVENGQEVVRPALSDVEHIFFPGIGTLEAFNTDGLRTLARTLDAPNMKEKTLRYPGHAERMTVLRELGFFSKVKSINLNGVKASPLEMTAQILFPKWKLGPGEADVTVFRVLVEGMEDGQKVRHTIDMQDRYCADTGVHSMARTTGYTATLALRMIADGLYVHKGISPPEYIGRRPECVEYLLSGLADRGVFYHESMEVT